MNGRLTEGTTAGDLILLQSHTKPQAQDLFYFPHGYPFLGQRSLLHLSVKSTSPSWCPAAPASIRVSSEFHSGHVNNDSGPDRFAFHIPPESVFTSSRNPYSPFPGTLIHTARIPHRDVFRRFASQPVGRVVERINPILRGWVNYFAVGHSSRCFSFVKDWVEKKV